MCFGTFSHLYTLTYPAMASWQAAISLLDPLHIRAEDLETLLLPCRPVNSQPSHPQDQVRCPSLPNHSLCETSGRSLQTLEDTWSDWSDVKLLGQVPNSRTWSHVGPLEGFGFKYLFGWCQIRILRMITITMKEIQLVERVATIYQHLSSSPWARGHKTMTVNMEESPLIMCSLQNKSKKQGVFLTFLLAKPYLRLSQTIVDTCANPYTTLPDQEGHSSSVFILGASSTSCRVVESSIACRNYIFCAGMGLTWRC